MRAWQYWLFRFSLFCLTLAPAFGEEAEPPKVHATPAMWVAHGPKGTAYLLGSVHALPENIDWQTPQIRAAIKASNTFVFEVAMDSDSRRMAGRMLGDNMLLPLSVSLPSFFDAQMRSEWRAAVMHTQINADTLVIMQPWYAARMLEDAMSGHIPIYAAEGVDNKIYAMAQAKGASVRPLETAEQSLHGLMRDANMTNEMAQLRAAMHEAAIRPITPFTKLLAAWEKGDPKGIAAAGPDIEKPEVRKALLDDRNAAWLPKIEKMLRTEHRTFFITVGAAHLVGAHGVPSLLRADGFTVDGPDQKVARN
jgi:uncharacterized protein YbaP (TraB family)